MNIDPNTLLGPVGLTAALLFAVYYVVRLLVSFVREYIADLKARLDIAMAGWTAQTEATNRVADAFEDYVTQRENERLDGRRATQSSRRGSTPT